MVTSLVLLPFSNLPLWWCYLLVLAKIINIGFSVGIVKLVVSRKIHALLLIAPDLQHLWDFRHYWWVISSGITKQVIDNNRHMFGAVIDLSVRCESGSMCDLVGVKKWWDSPLTCWVLLFCLSRLRFNNLRLLNLTSLFLFWDSTWHFARLLGMIMFLFPLVMLAQKGKKQ